ncbi:MAG: hypothetical protein ACC628_02205 [Pirellulaceae bacterium]
MSVCSLPDTGAVNESFSVPGIQSIEGCVQRVLRNSHPLRIASERRRGTRHAYPHLIQLVPADGECESTENALIVVLGKHISNRGLDFYSAHPLPFRRAIVCFARTGTPDVRLLMDLTWCRFCGHGWYENGGRFLKPKE